MKSNAPKPSSGTSRMWWVIALVLVLGVGGGWLAFRGKEVDQVATFTVRRGTLPISVLQGGTVTALKSQQIRSEIKGREGTKILSIVEEGYLVTDEDVAASKILVELDSAELVKSVTSQEIQFQTTQAGLIEAQQSYEIQVIQNQSDLKAAEQTARFAYLDFAKYMGGVLATEIAAKAGLDLESTLTNQPVLPKLSDLSGPTDDVPGWANPAAAGPNGARPNFSREEGEGRRRPRRSEGESPVAGGGAEGRRPQGGRSGRPGAESGSPQLAEGERSEGAGRAPRAAIGIDEQRGAQPRQFFPPAEGAGSSGNPAAPDALVAREPVDLKPTVKIDFTAYLEKGEVGDGDAQQKLRESEDALLLAKADMGLAKTKFEGTQRLFEKEFVTQSDLDRDQVNFDKTRLSVKKAETALALWRTYDFPKQAELLLAAYEESLRLLTRVQKESISKLAQADAKLASAQSRYRLEKLQLEDWQAQLGRCIIRATSPGLVVYANSEGGYRGGSREPIQEGTSVYERQEILTIPDMSQMAVEIKVHESHIQRISKGLPARVRVEAFPDEALTGEVSKVGLVPDSQDRWMNPDLKVYRTTVGVVGSFPWLKPGMSAKVEILVKELTDVVYVPLQAVSVHEGQRVCYIANAGQPQRRVVRTGEFSDQFIEIKEGLTDGEAVLLLAPKYLEPANGSTEAEQPPEATESAT